MSNYIEQENESIQDVADDVLERAKKYGFKPDEDMVRGAVEESANLLNIELTEPQITEACQRVMNPRDVGKMTYFFGAENPLSNWHPAVFFVNEVRFLNNEQFMMYCKAKLFGDDETASKIINATTPREHKALGRQVRGFDEAKWNEKRELYVRKGCHAKFSQNPDMLKFLLDTDGTELVEASPYDRIWGVGLAANNPAIHDKSKWLGLNLLGKCLMQVREQLMEQRLQQKESRLAMRM